MASDPVGVAACFGFQFQKRVYILCEQATCTRFGVVSCHWIFVKLLDLEDPIPRTSSMTHESLRALSSSAVWRHSPVWEVRTHVQHSQNMS